MKRFLFAVVALLGMFSIAHAQSANGPFDDASDMTDYWTGVNNDGSAMQLFVNGSKVYDVSGFGPAYIEQYFVCQSDGKLRQVCEAVATGWNFFDGYEALSSLTPLLSGSTIYLDNSLYSSGDPASSAYITTCYGDSSLNGTITYYLVTHYADGFGPPFFQSCY